MMQRPEHLVWFEMAGIVGLLALLLGPLAFLATEMMGGGGGGGGGAIAASVIGPSPRAERPVPWRGTGATPIAGLSSRPARGAGIGAGGTAVPFSEQWRSEATPSLSRLENGAAGSVGGRRSGRPVVAPGLSGASGGQAFADRGSDVASSGGPRRRGIGSRPVGRRGQVLAGGSGADRQEATSSEAKRLAGKMQALSGQLRQMEGDQSEGASAEQAGSDPGSPEGPDRRDPGSPENVPIGDHLHWLAGLGVLWGIWRLGPGA